MPEPTLAENDIIDRIQAAFPERLDLCTFGIGDDAVQLRLPFDVVTTDTMCEGVHFDRRFTSLHDIAFRCLTSNLSDIAAMGCSPGPYTLSLALPTEGYTRAEIDQLLAGLVDCAKAHGQPEWLWLIGGDVVRSPSALVLTITLMGSSAGKRVLRRSRAQVGDLLVVFRPLGASALGLALLQAGRGDLAPQAVAAFCTPIADTALGPTLAQCPAVHAAMDLSDGLLNDLPRLLKASNCGAELHLERLPIAAEVRAGAAQLGLSHLDLALAGGEEYAILAAVSPDGQEELDAICAEHGRDLLPIGRILAKPGLRYFFDSSQYLPTSSGFAHFPCRDLTENT